MFFTYVGYIVFEGITHTKASLVFVSNQNIISLFVGVDEGSIPHRKFIWQGHGTLTDLG